VPGLRREEVAILAGVSVDYYTRLERGNARGASDTVLEALARALQLDEAERAHLFHLVHAAKTTTRARRRPTRQQVRPNHARFLFLNPQAIEFYHDWDRLAHDTVAVLRAEAGHNPYDRALSDLIGELSTRSESFRQLWAAHNVRHHRTGTKRIHHPTVGDLTLTYEAMELTADPGLTLITYTAEPGSASQDALNLLASWSATLDQAETAQH
jgi:transcriptional regulator with XRE-family HTH domain